MSTVRSRQFRGDRLRTLRKARGLSQGELGKRIGAHVTSISDWERGANAPSGRHVASLSAELGVAAEHFYGDEDDEEDHVLALELLSVIRRIRNPQSNDPAAHLAASTAGSSTNGG